MPGATFIQVVKAVMLVAGVTVVAVLVLNRFDWNIDGLLASATADSGLGSEYLEPGSALRRRAPSARSTSSVCNWPSCSGWPRSPT